MHFNLLLLPTIFVFLGFSAAKPTPTRPFVAIAFQSPYPPNTNGQLSGIPVTAKDGFFYLNSPSYPSSNVTSTNIKDAVFWVDIQGQAWLDSKDPQQVYLDTRTGALSYLAPTTAPPLTFSAGALITNFLHLGEGTSITTPLPGNPGFFNAGPGTFEWLGSTSNPTWFACPRAGKGYQVLKLVGGKENWNLCVGGVQLIAVDYNGPSPAVGVY